jgi:hypothetical protein
MRCVTDGRAPLLTDRDTRLRDDPEWLEAAAAYLELRMAYDELGAKIDGAKERLIAQAIHAKARRRRVGYVQARQHRVQESAGASGIDIQACRGAAREEVRVLIG